MERPIRLAPETWSAQEKLAVQADMTLGQLIRDAVDREIRRRKPAKTSVRADEQRVAPLRVLLAEDLAFAPNWRDLLSRLSRKGYGLAESGGGLILYDLRNGQRLCKGSELGYPYARLMQRFGQPFPASQSQSH